jgi:RNA polymerase sigma-70 factor (ECF subfamily)
MENIDEIWAVLQSRLKSFVYSKIHDPEEVDDILQEAFIRLHSHIDGLKDRDKIVPWVFQITRNLITDHFRRRKREQNNAIPFLETGEDMWDSAIIEEAVRDMIGLMNDLPTEYCEALCATELEGLSQTAYAQKAGIPYSTAKSRVQRAKKHLRDLMMRCCHYQFDKYGTILSIQPASSCCCCF